MMEKVAEGDTALIPAISQMTDGTVALSASSEECLAWWKREKQRWTLRTPAQADSADAKSTEKTLRSEETP
jgi:hypothetical protein